MLRKLWQNRKGQGLVEYALLIAGVALCAIVGVSLFGEKTGDMISAVATVLPAADAGDNGPIAQGHLIETTGAGSGNIQLAVGTIVQNANTARLGNNVAGAGEGFGGLVVDPNLSSNNTGT
jgi:Flp pilus assembly pilin Flp